MSPKILILSALCVVLFSIPVSDASGHLPNRGYLGCYKDNKPRDLPYWAGHRNSIDKCITSCQRKKFKYAGMQYEKQCWCGDHIGLYGKSKGCNMKCVSKGGTCGGSWANSVYKTNASPFSGYLGCFKDKESRDLPVYIGKFWATPTESCIKQCRRNGYKYAGLQYYDQCRCGNSYGSYGKAKRCETPCKLGSAMCGGAWKNSIYRVG